MYLRIYSICFSILFGMCLFIFGFKLPHSVAALPDDVLCVNESGSGSCFASIQAAIDEAEIGDTVRVSQGTYEENILLDKVIILEGGWNADFSNRDLNTFPTTIAAATESNPVVSISGVIDQTVGGPVQTLDGFHITGGLAHLSGEHGGGLQIRNGNTLVQNNHIYGNSGSFLGGGVYIAGGFPTLRNNEVFSNTVFASGDFAYGGGVEIESGRPTLEGNLIFGNIISATEGYGGGINLTSGDLTLSDNQIYRNETGATTGYGGGLAIQPTGRVIISGSHLIENRAGTAGGGIYIGSRENGGVMTAGSISVTNSFLADNHAGAEGGGIYVSENGNVTLINSLMMSNQIGSNSTGNGIWSLGSVRFGNSVLIDHEGGTCLSSQTVPDFKSLGNNLVEEGNCGMQADFGDYIRFDPLIDFERHAGYISYTPRPGSPLIDSGANGICPSSDHLDRPRSFDGSGDGEAICDIGPVELSEVQEQTTFAVTTAADEDDGTCALDDCSLREAIAAANGNPGPDIIRMGAFESGTGLFQEMGQFEVTDSLNLFCTPSIPLNAGAGLGNRYMDISGGISVTLNHCDIQGGRADIGGGIRATGSSLTLERSFIGNHVATLHGGGIAIIDGSLTLSETTVSQNISDDFGGGISVIGTSEVMIRSGEIISNTALDGGGIYMVGGTLETAAETVLIGNVGLLRGGAVYASDGSQITFNESLATFNAAEKGGAVYLEDAETVLRSVNGSFEHNNAVEGGAIYNQTGTIHLRNCYLSNNLSQQIGGGIASISGVGTLEHCYLVTNGVDITRIQSIGGGGIYVDGGHFEIVDSGLTGNFAPLGGAIYNQGSLVIDQSGLRLNTITRGGGGLYQTGETSSAIIQNSTLDENGTSGSYMTTQTLGGAIYAINGELSLLNSSVVYNQAFRGSGIFIAVDESTNTTGPKHLTAMANNLRLTLGNSIIAHSIKDQGGVDCEIDLAVEVNSGSHNLSDSASCPSFTIGNVGLGVAERIVPGKVHYPLLSGSDAIDAGESEICTQTGNVDQRGAPRPAGPRCDIGAIEFDSSPITTPTPSSTPIPGSTPTPTVTPAPPGQSGEQLLFLPSILNE